MADIKKVRFGYFEDRYASKEQCQEMVGLGWSGLVSSLFDLCVKHDIHVVQVKEKFGGLRWYIASVHSDLFEEVHEEIDTAERISLITCDKCGEMGHPGTDGGYWVRTLCEKHHEERKTNG